MQMFRIQKYFYALESDFVHRANSTEKASQTPKQSPIIRDNKLFTSELRLIEQAVAEKRKNLLREFLQKNNILLEDMIAELKSRLNRPNENGKKYIRYLLGQLGNNAKNPENNQKKSPKITINTEQKRQLQKNAFAYDETRNIIFMQDNSETAPLKKMIQQKGKVTNDWTFQGKTIINPSFIFTNNSTLPITENSRKNPTNLQSHQNIDNITIYRENNNQKAIGTSVNIQQSGNNETQYLNCLGDC